MVFAGEMFQELMHRSYRNSLALQGESLKDRIQNDHRLA
jgi:hypothetical protein